MDISISSRASLIGASDQLFLEVIASLQLLVEHGALPTTRAASLFSLSLSLRSRSSRTSLSCLTSPSQVPPRHLAKQVPLATKALNLIISANTAFGSFFLSQPFLPKADHRWPIVKVMVQASESFFCCWRGSAPADLLQRDSCHDPQARPAYRLFHPVSYQDCSIKQVQASRPRPSRPRLRTQT